MNNEKEKTSGIYIEKNRFLKWLDNFWFHYKWPVIGIAFAVIVFLVCFVQSCTKENEDIIIVYAGPYQLIVEDFEVVNDIFDTLLPEDYDGDGEKNVAISRYHIYSNEQIKQITEEIDETNVPGFVDRTQNASQYDAYSSYILQGESSVLLLDPWLFEDLKNNGNGVLMKLDEAFSDLPENTLDGYGITLGETAIYNEYAGLRVLPEDTVVCLLRPIMIGKSRKEENYKIEKEMFAAITGVTVSE